MARRRAKRDPYTKDARDTLELIAKLLVSTSYRVPVEGTGTKQGLQATDIAAAVGYMENQLARETALAVATRAPAPAVAKLSALAYREVIRAVRQMRPRPLDLHQPADRWRLRIVVYDAAHEMIWPEHRKNFGELARAAKMRKLNYIRTHHVATSVLESALNEGGTELGKRLFAHHYRVGD